MCNKKYMHHGSTDLRIIKCILVQLDSIEKDTLNHSHNTNIILYIIKLTAQRTNIQNTVQTAHTRKYY